MESVGLENTLMFPLTVLKDITDNFSEEHVIGRGGSGLVYKGVFDNGEVIAVKKLDNKYGASGANLGNGEAQFHNELMNLIGVKHTNIIRLAGYCYEVQNIVTEYEGKRVFASAVEERILCLEYMQGGSLKNHFSVESCGLEWHVRYNIMKGICEGLKYLHTGYKKPIYHMDLKPENIFLDRNMIPKIGDFGISRLPADYMKTYDTKSFSGTLGYMPPEYIRQKQISHKSDVYSLGVIMIQVISGEEGYRSYDPHRPSEEFIERVHENWSTRQQETMSSHSLEQVKTCTEIALRCVEFDRRKRPTITDIVNELNKIDAAQSSAPGCQNTEEDERTTLDKQADIQEQNEKNTGHLEGKMKEVDGRSAASSLQPGLRRSHEQDILKNGQHIQGQVLKLGSWEQHNPEILHLLSGIQRLKDAMPALHNLIDEAEWRNRQNCELLPKLKDAVHDADDLLDEFRCYEMNVELERNGSKSPFTDFFHSVIQGSYNKLDDIQARLDHLSSRLGRSVRPATGCIPNEESIVGRDSELKQVIRLLIPDKYSTCKRKKSQVKSSTSIAQSNQLSKVESRTQSIAVLPILGIGGVGKTAFAQHICANRQVKSHFNLIIWICFSDGLDETRLIKDATLDCSGREETIDNLLHLQRAINYCVNNRRLPIVLDDMWDDALKGNGQCWEEFYSALIRAGSGRRCSAWLAFRSDSSLLNAGLPILAGVWNYGCMLVQVL